MAIVFLTPDEVAQQYLTHLKGLKPEVNIDQTDSDWYIRSKVNGGIVAGIYGDQRKVADDAFPQSARREALEKHLNLYFGSGFKQATQSVGDVSVSGTIGTVYPAGTEFLYEPNGNTYQSDDIVTLTGPTGLVPVTSVNTGQSQNLLAGAALKLSSPPAGSLSNAVTLTTLSDGRDLESNEEAATRILTRVRNPISGGTVTDYQQWATEADASVIESNVIRYVYGPGTVGVVFTAGTTDIDAALNNGDPVIRVPSDELVQTVYEYIEAKNPLTDCVSVFKPNVVTVDVTVRVRFVDGDLNTIPTNQTLTQEELVQREVKRAIYKTPPGGRRFGASGFVVVSEIEEVIDTGLSSSPYTEGEFAQILTDRQVDDLTVSGTNRMILETEIAEPGTITVVMY